MKFVQRDLGTSAEVSSGGGHRGILVEFRSLILLSAAVLVVIGLFFAAAAEIAVRMVTPEQESRWLRSLATALSPVEPKDDTLESKLARARVVLAQLTAQPGVPRLEYRLILLSETAPNAVALPGGTIGVTEGLLRSLDNDASLAFVLGHELGHFRNRDHLRAMVRDTGRGTAIALIFGGDGMLTTNADRWLSLGYSRQQEFDADRFGLDLVHAVYGKTDGSDALFRLLRDRSSVPPWAHMFQTHPDLEERLRRLEARAAELGDR